MSRVVRVIKTRLGVAILLALIQAAQSRVVGPYFPRNNDLNRIDDDYSRNVKVNGPGELGSARLSEAEWSTYNLKEPNGPGTYAFGYDNVVDPMGNEHYRSEEKLQNGTIVGEYGYTDYQAQRIVRVTYTADMRGYRAKTQILPLDA